MMVICQNKGESVIVGDNCHITHYERGGISSLGSIMPTVLRNQVDGTIDLNEIRYKIPLIDDQHIVPIRGISLESSQNNCSGQALRMDYIAEVKKIAKKYKMKMHLDGARAWNSAVFLNMEIKDMVQDFDIVNVCLSKGMGCPAGSLLMGTY